MKTQPFWVVMAKCDNYNMGWTQWVVCVQLAPDDAAKVITKLREQAALWEKQAMPVRARCIERVQEWHKRYPPQTPAFAPVAAYGGGGSVGTLVYVTSGVTFGIGGATSSTFQEPTPDQHQADAEYRQIRTDERTELAALVEKLGMMDRRFPWVTRESLDVPEYEVIETSDDPHTEAITDASTGPALYAGVFGGGFGS